MKTFFSILIFLLAALRVAGAADTMRFAAVDLFIDPKGEPLAAYQLEIQCPAGTKIVGVEGGDNPEFRKAPYYDPKGMQTDRLVIAAFSVAEARKLPRDRTRVLTLHLETTSLEAPKLEPILKIAAKPSGQKIRAELKLAERKEP